MTGSAQCPHLEFSFNVNVARIEDDTLKMADITGKCQNCGKPMVFRSDLPIGVNWSHPTISPDAQELRIPCYVEGDEVDEKRRRAGFSVSMREDSK